MCLLQMLRRCSFISNITKSRQMAYTATSWMSVAAKRSSAVEQALYGIMQRNSMPNCSPGVQQAAVKQQLPIPYFAKVRS